MVPEESVEASIELEDARLDNPSSTLIRRKRSAQFNSSTAGIPPQVIRLSAEEHSLPVTKVSMLLRDSSVAEGSGAGNSNDTQASGNKMRVEVGPLVCKGKRSLNPDEWTGCDDLYNAGVRSSGYYWINDGDSM
jgi:hypothetical protein